MERIRNEVESGIKHAKKRIEEFKSNLDTNAVQAFNWSEDAMGAAAEIEVFTLIGKYIDAHEQRPAFTLDALITELDDRVSHAVRHGLIASSTSGPSNMMERKLGIAWTNIWHGNWPSRGMRRQVEKLVEEAALEVA